MTLPDAVPVMTLPNAILFPQALLPLYVFEAPYRQLLADALHGNRLFVVAMRHPESANETPAKVAGIGLIRVAVGHKDHTAHVILQGLARVKLGRLKKRRPYPVHEIEPLPPATGSGRKIGGLLARARLLLKERVKQGIPFPFPFVSSAQPAQAGQPPHTLSAREMLDYLDSIVEPERATDLMAGMVLAAAEERQKILATRGLETRLRHLTHFLHRDLESQSQPKVLGQ